MTINERVSDERLIKPEIRDSKYWNGLEFKCDLYHLDMQDFYTYANMLTGADYRELQQYRAAAEPVVSDSMALAFHAAITDSAAGADEIEEIKTGLRAALANYAAPQVTSVLEIAARLVDTYLLNEGTDSEFIACYTISKNDRISEKGKQIWADWRALSAALKSSQTAPAVQAEQLSGNIEHVSQPYTLPEHSPCAGAPDHIWLQTAGEWPASGEFSELTWSCDNQHPDDTLYVRADLVGNFPCYLQGYKDGCEWSALMAEANHPQTGDWLFDDPIELAKAIRKGPDMLPAAPKQDFREIPNSSTNNCRENAETSTKCWCHTCRPVTMTDMRFVVCPECGNKRCPHANDHRNPCTGSNEPGQEGSAYPDAPKQEAE
ncbi:hypothetical protein [Atlantibacter hermannii]|uniref:hypothetical protein n=1 Tax=Atlantibacter hermannii TaxID=565 RepID=UPI0028AC71B0|nr:hypothetical protein [Atlantibacter hermannii]